MCRSVHWENGLEALYRDSRFALRSITRNRRFVLLAIMALALGIGSSTVAFSIVYGVLFHPLPYKDSNRLVVCLAKTQSAFKMSDIRGGPCNVLHG
jgi:hypothetical protein